MLMTFLSGMKATFNQQHVCPINDIVLDFMIRLDCYLHPHVWEMMDLKFACTCIQLIVIRE